MAPSPPPLLALLAGVALLSTSVLASGSQPDLVVAHGVPQDDGCLFGDVEVTLAPPPGRSARFEGRVTPDCRLVAVGGASVAGIAVDCVPDPSVPCPSPDGLLGIVNVLAGAVTDEANDPLHDEDGDPDPCPEATVDSVLAGGSKDPCRGDFGSDVEGGTVNPNVACRLQEEFLGAVVTRRTHVVHSQRFESSCIDLLTLLPAPPQLRLGTTECSAKGKYRLDTSVLEPCSVVQDQANLVGEGHGYFYKERKNLSDTRFHSLHSAMDLWGGPPYACVVGWQGNLPVGFIGGFCAFFP